jgi:hypothetical protein
LITALAGQEPSATFHIFEEGHYRIELRLPKTVGQVLYETDLAIVVFDYNECIAYLERMVEHLGGVKEEQALLKYLRDDPPREEALSLVPYGEDRFLHYRIQFMVAGLLQEGKASVFDRKAEEYVRRAELEVYANHSGGRRFRLPDGRIFFDIQDWVE